MLQVITEKSHGWKLAIYIIRLNDKGELEYTLLMETPQTPLTMHVEAVYRKECTENSPKNLKWR